MGRGCCRFESCYPDLRNLPEIQRLVWARSERKRATLAKARAVMLSSIKNCQFCGTSTTIANIDRHERSCHSNPSLPKCPVCLGPKHKNNVTCSFACSNTYFRSGPNNASWSGENYKLICKQFHKFKCVVCPESRLLDVHHMDGNRENNEPKNLIFLCATHHRYWHSRYRNLIEAAVRAYILKWKAASSDFSDNVG